MERREIVICDLAEACRESERLSGVTAKDRWEIVRYETAERSGTGIALWDAYPKRVTRLSEWYVTSRLGTQSGKHPVPQTHQDPFLERRGHEPVQSELERVRASSRPAAGGASPDRRG